MLNSTIVQKINPVFGRNYNYYYFKCLNEGIWTQNILRTYLFRLLIKATLEIVEVRFLSSSSARSSKSFSLFSNSFPLMSSPLAIAISLSLKRRFIDKSFHQYDFILLNSGRRLLTFAIIKCQLRKFMKF